MDTPIYDFVKEYAGSRNVRAHMPGHKGKSFLGFEQFDITEISGADVLYRAKGIIRRSEENAARIFSSAKTVYSTEGSSLSIRAMLYLIKRYALERGERPLILAGRNAHKAFISACALLDIDVDWIFPENGSYLCMNLSGERLKCILSGYEKKPTAVYITAPDYLGNSPDINELAQVCRSLGVLLAVDNAHGAYLNFLSKNLHPISNGADICCDSAHKTLPALTGGAYLHISNSAPEFFADNAETAMELFSSTSPSYLVLSSLDYLNQYLCGDYAKKLSRFIMKMDGLKSRLCGFGYRLEGEEPLKLAISCREYGYSGNELALALEKLGIYCEFSDPDYLVMMLTPENDSGDLERIEKGLLSVERKPPIPSQRFALPAPEQVIRPHDAIMLGSCEIPTLGSEGRIAASLSVSCPPAVPIVSLGERISGEAVKMLCHYGIDRVRVLRLP